MPLIFNHARNSRLTGLLLKRRSTTYHSRKFHASKPHQLVDQALLLSHGAFQLIHTASGLPWGPSIFLTGILFRVVFLPLEVLYQRNKKTLQTYQPLIYGWRSEFMRQAMRKQEGGKIGPGPKAAEAWVEKEVMAKRKMLSARHGYRPWISLLPLVSAPAWIINTDVVRRMVGMKQSLISFFQTEDGLIDPSFIPPDASIASEGFFWVPNLAWPDPVWVLPLTLWALVVSQVYLRIKDAPLLSGKQISNLPTFNQRLLANLTTRLRETGVILGLSLGPILILAEVPGALVLYWVAASGTLVLERLLVQRIVGLGKPFKPALPLRPRMKKAR